MRKDREEVHHAKEDEEGTKDGWKDVLEYILVVEVEEPVGDGSSSSSGSSVVVGCCLLCFCSRVISSRTGWRRVQE